MVQNGKHQTMCDDADTKLRNMSLKTWRLCLVVSEAREVRASGAFELQSSLQFDLLAVFDHFGNRILLTKHEQGLLLCIMHQAYATEEKKLRK